MSIQEQAPETDLWLPLPPNGAEIDPHTIHTHYFGFSIPEANLGGFIYIRYQPAFPLSQGGVCRRARDESLKERQMSWQ
jgi:hypothetical protein